MFFPFRKLNKIKRLCRTRFWLIIIKVIKIEKKVIAILFK